MNLIEDVREGMKGLRQDRHELQKFAAVVSSVLIILSGLVFWLNKNPGKTMLLTGITIALILTALIRPRILRPIYRAWMLMAFSLGAIVSRLILIILFYLIVTPTGLLMRILGKDPLLLIRSKKTVSYWQPRTTEEKSIETYKRPF